MNIIATFNTRRRVRRNIKRKFEKKLNYSPNLQKPATYCEKIQWLKINRIGKDKKVIERADKYLVREYVKQQGFEDSLIPLLGCWDTPGEIDWSNLPEQFVIKLNNGSGEKFRWFVKDIADFNIPDFINEARESMSKPYGANYGEYHYSKMPSKILVEAFLQDNGKPVKDYKFYCFDGKVAFFSVEEGKISGPACRDYYNLDWENACVSFYNDLPKPPWAFSRPENFSAMVKMAEKLSRGWPHMRVDLYNINGQVLFGELTYTPEDGLTQWNPIALDYEYGKLIDIYNISH